MIADTTALDVVLPEVALMVKVVDWVMDWVTGKLLNAGVLLPAPPQPAARVAVTRAAMASPAQAGPERGLKRRARDGRMIARHRTARIGGSHGPWGSGEKVPLLRLMVRVVVALPLPGVTDGGLKAAVNPGGRP